MLINLLNGRFMPRKYSAINLHISLSNIYSQIYSVCVCVRVWPFEVAVRWVTCGFCNLRGVGCRHGNAHFTFGKLVTGEHLRPGEAEGLHDGGAAVPHGLAHPAARVDRPLQAHGSKERAQEDLRVRVAVLVHQRHPAAGLLLHLGHGLVLQQVGQHHPVVAHVVTEPQVVRNVHALGRLAVDGRIPGQVLVLWRPAPWQECHRHQQPEHPAEALTSRAHNVSLQPLNDC